MNESKYENKSKDKNEVVNKVSKFPKEVTLYKGLSSITRSFANAKELEGFKIMTGAIEGDGR